jgi:uncharacterized protein (DUF58 family)
MVCYTRIIPTDWRAGVPHMRDETRQLRIRPHLRFLPFLAGLLLLLQLLFPSRVWTTLLVLVGGGWLLNFVWARTLVRKLQLTREMRFGWAQVGDRLQERFTLTNQGWAPGFWAEIVDHSSIPDYPAGRVTSVGYKESLRWQTDGVCTRRGLYTLGPTSLRTSDPFGLYEVELHYPESTILMVMPPIVPLPAIEIAPGGRAGEGRRPRADALERTVSVSSVREYQPGDTPKWIHWPTSVRHDSLFVRLFDSTPASDWWIFLDMAQDVQSGQDQDSTDEHGVILAASLADRGLRAGHAVGLVTHGEELVWLPPQCTQAQRMEILRALAVATTGTHRLSQLLERTRPSFKRGASLVIITSDLEGEWIEALVPLLWSGVTPTVLLLDPVSFGGTGDVNKTLALLSNLGIARYTITRDVLDRPEARPGRRGQWEWRFLGTGRAIPVHRPSDTRWQRLA